jgi:hypothetical protein
MAITNFFGGSIYGVDIDNKLISIFSVNGSLINVDHHGRDTLFIPIFIW